jgi:hypothetical protein
MDAGTRATADAETARQDIARAEPELARATAARDRLQARWDALTARLAALGTELQQTIASLEAARRRLAASAVRAYVEGGGKVDAALSAMGQAEDALQVSRDLHLISTYGEYESDLVDRYERAQHEIEQLLLDVSTERADVRAQLDAMITHVADVQAALEHARARLAGAEATLVRFHVLATTASSPILGPNRLTAQQLADFVRTTGYTPHITVSIDELAQYYIEESAKIGVRGDVAWAQSILETGGFGFEGSMVEPEDNNFAGIGACDSCTRGFQFANARVGVRAQMQLLRVYTDRSVTRDSLPDPLVLPGTLRLGFRGRVQSWWDLTGTWATANDYGIRVYNLYMGIVETTRATE